MIYSGLQDLTTQQGLPLWSADVVYGLILAVAVVMFIAVSVLFMVWLERKVSADIQQRYGPMRTGWHGSLQTAADTVKLLFKEDIIPRAADRPLFFAAPVIVFVAAFLSYVVIPFAPGAIVRDLNIGLLYFMAVPSLGVIGVIIAGWASGSKYAVLGGLRSAGQLISYEVPRTLSVLGVVLIAGSLSTVGIVESQLAGVWFVLLQPVGFLIYFVTSLAELNRVPFDIPEAESELVAGYFTEYSGMRWSFFMMAEYAHIFAACAMGVVLFFGGWQGFGPVPSWIWFLLKTFALVWIVMWLRWTLPRFRLDQVMDLGWKFLLPLSLANLFVTGIIVLAV